MVLYNEPNHKYIPISFAYGINHGYLRYPLPTAGSIQLTNIAAPCWQYFSFIEKKSRPRAGFSSITYPVQFFSSRIHHGNGYAGEVTFRGCNVDIYRSLRVGNRRSRRAIGKNRQGKRCAPKWLYWPQACRKEWLSSPR